jgi:hypothetical protein
VDHRRRYCWCNRISCLQLITDRSPKDRYQTKVESWRDLQSESSLRWNGLREPIGRSAPVLCSRFGRPRIKYEHNYPAYFPQAISNPQHPCYYPDDALGRVSRMGPRLISQNRFRAICWIRRDRARLLHQWQPRPLKHLSRKRQSATSAKTMKEFSGPGCLRWSAEFRLTL